MWHWHREMTLCFEFIRAVYPCPCLTWNCSFFQPWASVLINCLLIYLMIFCIFLGQFHYLLKLMFLATRNLVIQEFSLVSLERGVSRDLLAKTRTQLRAKTLAKLTHFFILLVFFYDLQLFYYLWYIKTILLILDYDFRFMPLGFVWLNISLKFKQFVLTYNRNDWFATGFLEI